MGYIESLTSKHIGNGTHCHLRLPRSLLNVLEFSVLYRLPGHNGLPYHSIYQRHCPCSCACPCMQLINVLEFSVLYLLFYLAVSLALFSVLSNADDPDGEPGVPAEAHCTMGNSLMSTFQVMTRLGRGARV